MVVPTFGLLCRPGEGPPELIEWFPRRCEFISPPRLSLSMDQYWKLTYCTLMD